MTFWDIHPATGKGSNTCSNTMMIIMSAAASADAQLLFPYRGAFHMPDRFYG
jgi:hypothetical protein